MPSFSGLYNNEFGQNYALLTRSQALGNSRDNIGRPFSKRVYSRMADREVLIALIGAAAGAATATSTHKRVSGQRNLSANILGSVVPIETFTGINRVTTAADITDWEGALAITSQPTYPIDRSGNGGGGKRGV